MSMSPGNSASEPTHPFEGLAPPPERFYKPAGALAITSVAIAALVTCIELVDVPFAYRAGQAYTAAGTGGFVSDAPVNDYRLALGWLVVSALSWAVACAWLTRARHNAEAISTARHRRARAWIWLGWFVPVVSLWFPFQVVKDIYSATDQRKDSPLVGWWWGAFLLYLISGQVVESFVPVSGRSDDESLATTLALLEGGQALCATLALWLWIRLVVAIERDQRHQASLPSRDRKQPTPQDPPRFTGEPPVW